MTRRLALAILTALAVAGCNSSSSPTSPSPTPPPTTTTPPPAAIQRFTLTGVIRNLETNAPVGGARVVVTSTATQTNASGTTDGNGYYSIGGVGVGGPTTIAVTADRHNGVTQTATLALDERRDIAIAPFFVRTGSGNTVFDMPSYVSRVRITGRWQQRDNSNFIVRIGGSLVVNEVLRTSLTYDGLHSTRGGVVEITNSSAIAWEFRQEQ